MEIEMTIERDGKDIQITAEVELCSSCRGARGAYGEQLEPDTEASGEVLDAWDASHAGVDLTQAEEGEAIRLAFEAAADAAEARAEARAEAQADWD